MSADPALEEDDQYASSEDSDFAPDVVPAAASDSEDEADEPASKRHPAKGNEDGADDAGYHNSGDEAIIEKGRKRRRRAQDKGVDEYEEGGEGGLVKTRRQRAAECVLSIRLPQGSSLQLTAIVSGRKSANTPPPLAR